MKTNRKYLIITRQTNCSSAAQTALPTCDTGGSRGSGLYHAVAAVALEHDLPPVLDLPHVGPVLVQPHVADQQDLPVLDEAREGTVDLFTPGSQPGPVAEVALGGVVPLQHVAVPTLQYQCQSDCREPKLLIIL